MVFKTRKRNNRRKKVEFLRFTISQNLAPDSTRYAQNLTKKSPSLRDFAKQNRGNPPIKKHKFTM